MTSAEQRMLLELRPDLRRVVDRMGARWLSIEVVGGCSSYSGEPQGPKAWRCSRQALASLLRKGLVELKREVGGSYPERHYGLTEAGRVGVDSLQGQANRYTKTQDAPK